jgi:hypothetical protein
VSGSSACTSTGIEDAYRGGGDVAVRGCLGVDVGVLSGVGSKRGGGPSSRVKSITSIARVLLLDEDGEIATGLDLAKALGLLYATAAGLLANGVLNFVRPEYAPADAA